MASGRRGITLVEMLCTLAIASVLLGALSYFLLSTARSLTWARRGEQVHTGVLVLREHLERDVQAASGALESVVLDGRTYRSQARTGSDTLILRLPAFDPAGRERNGVYDFIVYERKSEADGSRLTRRVFTNRDAQGGSLRDLAPGLRRADTRELLAGLDARPDGGGLFEFDQPVLAQARAITLRLRVQLGAEGETAHMKERRYAATFRLRNR
ncbi:MAG TPA: prepilin-type N-terminal cleavage/methylation domain-containing protein [bacterium]